MAALMVMILCFRMVRNPSRSGKLVRVYGGASLNRVSASVKGPQAAAIELGLVDELRMFRNPVIVGVGTPFLPAVTEDVGLHLIET